jgi:PBSX family phage terminase large subunit
MTLVLQPLSPKQRLSIQQSNAFINIWEGSVRSGKTISSTIRNIQELENGPDGDYMIVGKTQDALKRNIIGPMQQMLGVDCRYLSGMREMHLWGKKIHIVGASDERAEGKIQGVTLAGAYVDEASLLTENFFNMLTSRCTVPNAKIFVTTNPDSPYHWLKTNYLDNQKARDENWLKSWHFTLDDNTSLTPDVAHRLKNQYKGLWYKRYIEGKWVLAEGTIYDFFDEKIHALDFPPTSANYYICGVDYGTTNPCAFTLIGYNPQNYPNLWLEEEYYWNSREKNRQKTDSEYAEDLKKFLGNRHIKAIIIDPSAASFKAELIKIGMQNIMDAKNEVLDGIRFMSSMISNGTFKFCKHCRNTIKEIASYVWDEKSIKLGEDRPLKQHDHCLDSIRYVLETYFKPMYEGSQQMDVEAYRRWKSEQGWK